MIPPTHPLYSCLDLSLALLAAHMVGDFLLQTTWMVQEKRRPGVLLLHGGIVAAVSYLFAGRWSSWELPVIIGITHVAIDFCKVRLPKITATTFTIDQLAHLMVIVGLACFGSMREEISLWTEWWGQSWWVALAAISGFILTVRVGGLLIGYWVQPYLDEIQHAVISIETPLRSPRGLTNGGRVIGQWERALIFLFIGLGQPASIGFLIAAKSIFRFGELKDRENRMEAEYITIGTLMSFGWAMAVSYPVWWAVRTLM